MKHDTVFIFDLSICELKITGGNNKRLIFIAEPINDDDIQRKIRNYRDDRINFINKIKTIVFTIEQYDVEYGIVDYPIRVYKDLLKFFDETLGKKYSIVSYGHNIENHRRNKILLLDQLREISKIFNLNDRVKLKEIREKLPEDIETEKQYQTITVKMNINNLSEEDRAHILLNDELKGKQIKKLLDNYIDLSIYVINIKNIQFIYHISQWECNVEIILSYELITVEDYYNTMGRYKIILKNVCKNGKFDSSDINKIADELSVDISQMTSDEKCEKLSDIIYNLEISDFEIEK